MENLVLHETLGLNHAACKGMRTVKHACGQMETGKGMQYTGSFQYIYGESAKAKPALLVTGFRLCCTCRGRGMGEAP